MACTPPPAWRGGGVKILEKSLLGRGGAEIFILVAKGGGGGSRNLEVKIKIA